jgi:hypothetical protein
MAEISSGRSFYRRVKANAAVFEPDAVAGQLAMVDQGRVESLAAAIQAYLSANLPAVLNSRRSLGAYRMNPYVLMTSASTMKLDAAAPLARFLFDTKFYMSLETSFGKSIESQVVGVYPFGAAPADRWGSPVEKAAESMALASLSNEDKALQRTESVWREIDQSCVAGDRRYLLSIKSGPSTINDSQVAAMYSALSGHWREWRDATYSTYPAVKSMDVVIGLTYGTDRTTNNKENQILVKLQRDGFAERDPDGLPGVLFDPDDGRVRVYRRVGRDFWALIGNPSAPQLAQFAFLEVLLGLARGLSMQTRSISFEAALNSKLQELASAIAGLSFAGDSLPAWLGSDFTTAELAWLSVAMTAFFDEGI